MKLNKNQRKALTIGLPILALLVGAFLAFSAHAQAAPPPTRSAPEAVDATSNYIPVQGFLTDSSGNPLDGTYALTYRLYDVQNGGTPLCEDGNDVLVTKGLFSDYMKADDCSDNIDGRALYLGIEVGSDGEMVPRSFVDNVPYAWSLRPGAEVTSDVADPVLTLNNTASGRALWAASVTGTGVYGTSWGGAGVHGNSLTGSGVLGESYTGAAVAATGTGIITSTAESYLWVSGNDFRPLSHADSTVIDLDTIGGAQITRGADAGVKYVVLPITLPGTLYGQDVILTGLDIHWVGETEFDGLTDVRLRRQVGVCPTCYEDILHDSADYVCDLANNLNGCVLHFDLTSNNVLSADSGIVYLGVGLNFSGSTTYVELGGVRLSLEYHK